MRTKPTISWCDVLEQIQEAANSLVVACETSKQARLQGRGAEHVSETDIATLTCLFHLATLLEDAATDTPDHLMRIARCAVNDFDNTRASRGEVVTFTPTAMLSVLRAAFDARIVVDRRVYLAHSTCSRCGKSVYSWCRSPDVHADSGHPRVAVDQNAVEKQLPRILRDAEPLVDTATQHLVQLMMIMLARKGADAVLAYFQPLAISEPPTDCHNCLDSQF